jgi:hypothetical protein
MASEIYGLERPCILRSALSKTGSVFPDTLLTKQLLGRADWRYARLVSVPCKGCMGVRAAAGPAFSLFVQENAGCGPELRAPDAQLCK